MIIKLWSRLVAANGGNLLGLVPGTNVLSSEGVERPVIQKELIGADGVRHVLRYVDVEGVGKLFTTGFLTFLVSLHTTFTPKVHLIRAQRAADFRLVHERGTAAIPNLFPDIEMPAEGFRGPNNPIPAELREPGIEISGPDWNTKMVINAVNGDPKTGERAVAYLIDAEDSSWPGLWHKVRGIFNRIGVVQGKLEFDDPESGKHYGIKPGKIPFLMHREPGLHLDSHEVVIDGVAVPQAILGTALTLFHVGQEQAERGQSINFYLPKTEGARDGRFWREFFDTSRAAVPHLREAQINAIPLVESVPTLFQMAAVLKELGPYGAGLNAARWDMQASILEFVMADPGQVWPDRFGIDIKIEKFLSDGFRRLVAVCRKGGYVPVGGMAVALPHKDSAVNELARRNIEADKMWEASSGFVRGWVAHVFHISTAQRPFVNVVPEWLPLPGALDPNTFHLGLQVPTGAITLAGTHRNALMLLRYVAGWLDRSGAHGINSLEGTAAGDTTPALMEDLATGRMSALQIAQRMRHNAMREDDPGSHSSAAVARILQEELEGIVARGGDRARYTAAMRIAMRWIEQCSRLDYASLGAWSYPELQRIGSGVS